MGDELTKRYGMYGIQQSANQLAAQQAQRVSNADVARGLALAQQQGGMSRGPAVADVMRGVAVSRERDRGEWIPWYCEDSPGWVELSLAARGVAEGIARKMGRNRGEIHLGSRGLRGLAKLLHARWEEFEPAMTELLAVGPDGEPPRLLLSDDQRVLIDPEHESRRRPTSTTRVHKHRAKVEPPVTETPETVSRVSPDHETGGIVSSPLLLSDLISSEKGEPERDGAVRRDLPLADDACAVWDSLTMNRDAGLPLSDVWIGFCGQYAGQDFRSREALLGRWQKWIGQQFKIADTDRERKRRAEDSRARRYADHVPKTEPQTAAQAKAFQAELMRRLAQKTGTG